MLSTDDQVAALRVRHIQDAGRDFDAAMTRVGSPIERLFLAHAIVCSDLGWTFPDYGSWQGATRVLESVGASTRQAGAILVDHPAGIYLLTSQLPLDVGGLRVRLDFAIFGLARGKDSLRLAVELDGHDFHDRTKDQASHDRRRDRALTRAGWRVVRFTGRDVYRDVAGCWEEVEDLMHAVEVR